MKRNWHNTKVLILGLSKSGTAAAKYLNYKGASCFISESKEKSEEGLKKAQELEKTGIKVEFDGHSDEFIQDSYICITSPGIPPHSEILTKLRNLKIPYISDIELAYLESPKPFIVITGTNGKTTTTALISHILNTEYKAPSCGNIGISPVNYIDSDIDYFVCEMSSYQAEYSPTLKPQIACFLTFTPDHIDWHGGIENYFNAKTKLFRDYKMPSFSVFSSVDKKINEFAQNYAGEKYMFGNEEEGHCCYLKNDTIYFKRDGKDEEIIKTNELQIVGLHNYQNAMAAIIVAKIIGLNNEKIKDALKTFEAVEHRIEFVKESNATLFYNDSKATNPEASIVALKSFKGKKVSLIAGGRDKNTSLGEFCDEVKNNINHVILIGEASARFDENLKNKGFNNIIFAKNLEEAIDKGIETGDDVILFSPACASFDMFKNYEERGKAFKEYVLHKI